MRLPLAITLVLGCLGSGSTEPQADLAAGEELLEELGYLDVAPPDTAPDGARLLDADAVQREGLRYWCDRKVGRAALVDVEGTEIRRWAGPRDTHWDGCTLGPGGDLFVAGVERRSPGQPVHEPTRFLARFDWEGREVWRVHTEAHHDVSLTADGRLLTLDMLDREVDRDGSAVLIRDHQLVWRDPDTGRRVAEASLYDRLHGVAELSLQWPGVTHGFIDIVHANTVAEVRGSERFPDGSIMVTSRHQHLVFVLAPGGGEVLWAWGPGTLMRPHEGLLQPDGSVLVFDNGGARRPWSRLVRVDPETESVSWEWRSDGFYTESRGGLVALPNGNLLVTDSNAGRAFELDTRGQIVWEFLNPHRTAKGERATFRRMSWVADDYLLPLKGGAP